MTTYFISRHPGAIEWANTQTLHIDQFLPHLDPTLVQPGDIVIGSLPVNLAAQVCAVRARYCHLTLELPAELRGRELSAAEMQRMSATIEQFEVKAVLPTD